MQDLPTGTFDALHPPAVDPTFSPPVAEPPLNVAPAPPAWGTVPPPPPGAERKSKTGRKILITVLALTAVGVISAAAGNTDKDSKPSSTFTEVTSPLAPSSGSTVSGSSSAGSSSSASSRGSSSSLTMQQWAARYGDDLTGISASTEAISDDAGDYDVAGMASDCRTLKSRIATAKSHLPIPDSDVNEAYSQALYYEGLAADYCISGATTLDPDDLSKSAEYIAKAGTYFHEAAAAMP